MNLLKLIWSRILSAPPELEFSFSFKYGSTIPYYVVEERKKLNRCIEEAPNDYEKEIYRAIRNMPVPYEKLNEILENSRDIITSKQNRKAKNRKFFATGIPIIFMILVVAIYTLLNKQGDD